jgi:glutamate synthase domain-containing protein 1
MGNNQGLYNPKMEHDACGIGFVAHVEGRRSHRVLEMALEALRNHAHRGAVADDRKTGDGAGILTQLPHEFFARELARMGIEPPASGDLAVGQIYLNKANGEDRAGARELMRKVLADLGLEMVGFRSVPVIESALGQRALISRPWFGQVIIRRTDSACASSIRRAKEASNAFTSPASARARLSTRAWCWLRNCSTFTPI